MNSSVEVQIDRLNILWSELLRVYVAKKKLPLANLDKPYCFIGADWSDQKVELRAYFEQWRALMTVENLSAFRAIQEEIIDLRQMFNKVISSLSMNGFTILSIDYFTPEDLLLFSEETVGLAPRLEEIKAQQVRLVKEKKFGECCKYRADERAILAAVAELFAKEYPGLYFKASWFKEKEIFFLPIGNWEMKALLKRVARDTYKNN